MYVKKRNGTQEGDYNEKKYDEEKERQKSMKTIKSGTVHEISIIDMAQLNTLSCLNFAAVLFFYLYSFYYYYVFFFSVSYYKIALYFHFNSNNNKYIKYFCHFLSKIEIVSAQDTKK